MRWPTSPNRIHLIGVAGSGMGALAGLLKQAGYGVTGSDENTYPPMSTKLRQLGVIVRTPFAVENLEPTPDLAIVGATISENNVEIRAMCGGDFRTRRRGSR